jgi:hypothetical protein
MNAEELANKFKQKVSAAVVEKDRQDVIAHDNEQKRIDDMEHCRNAMEKEVIPFLEEMKHHLGEEQFSFARLRETITVLSEFRSLWATARQLASPPHSAISSSLRSEIAERGRECPLFTLRTPSPTFQTLVT